MQYAIIVEQMWPIATQDDSNANTYFAFHTYAFEDHQEVDCTLVFAVHALAVKTNNSMLHH